MYSRHRLALTILWIYVAVYAAWVVGMLVGGIPRGVANDFLFLPLYFGAAATGIGAARASTVDPKASMGWRFLGMAWFVSGLGAVFWIAKSWWPSVWLDWSADIVYNLYYPLVLIGLSRLVVLPIGGLARMRLAIEGTVVVVATAVLAWYFVFRFQDAPSSLPIFVKKIGTLFLGELAVMFAVTAVLHSPKPHEHTAGLTSLSVGLFAASVADFLYEHARLLHSSWGPPIGDLLLATGAGLVISAALLAKSRSSLNTPWGQLVVHRGLTLLPYLAISVVGVLLFLEIQEAGPRSEPIDGLVAGGALLLMLVIARLLVAQRELLAEATERASLDARFRQLVQRSSDGILLLTADGLIRYASPAFERMVSAPIGTVAGHRIDEFVNPDDSQGLRAWLANACTGTPGRWQVGGDGSVREVEAVATDLTADPAVSGIVVNVRDVTERVRLEAQLQHAHQLEVVGRLASSVAHDFNNILGVILSHTQVAQLTIGASGVADDLTAIERATHRGAALARRLLGFGKPTSPAVGPVDLGEVVREMQETLRAVLPASIEIRLAGAAESLPVRLDVVQLEQVLLNLAINARDAMAEGGTLTIAVEAIAVTEGDPLHSQMIPPGRWARAMVTDSGVGMDSATLARAFEPFFTTKPSGTGTGLGLSTVRSVMNEVSGHVLVSSQPGRGTTVSLFLPLATGQLEPGLILEIVPIRHGIGRILIVDDEEALRRVVVRYLSVVGHQVWEAPDGRAALDVLEKLGWQIDLVLTDIVMPNMGGRELARAIRSKRPELPVLCMSGHPDALATGDEPWAASQIIAKPAPLELIAGRIADALSRFADSPASTVD